MAEKRALSEIDALRRRIDDLDEALVQLLSQRAECALAIGRVKKELGLEVYQPAREVEVLNHVQSLNPGPLDNGAIRRLFERVIDEARRLERLSSDGENEELRNCGPSEARSAERERLGVPASAVAEQAGTSYGEVSP